MSERVLLIGTGYLAEYLIPCFKRRPGENLASQMIGIKGSSAKLAERQQVFPFPLQVLGTEEALRRMQPDLILMAAKPNQVPDITKEVLAPYYQECRKEKRPLPVLYSFAPAPSVHWMTKTLGWDALVCNMLPNMIREVEGYPAYKGAVSFLSFDPNVLWDKEQRAAAEDFLVPTGNIVEVPGEQAAAYLAIKGATHAVYEFTTICCEVLKWHGVEMSYAAAAGGMRKALRDVMPADYPTPVPVAEGMEEKYLHFWRSFIGSYLGGIVQYGLDLGMEPEKAALMGRCAMETNLSFVQHATPETMKAMVASHATKGGMLEKHNEVFREAGYDKLAQGWNAYVQAEMSEFGEALFDDTMADIAYSVTEKVALHTARMSGIEEE